MTVTRKKLFNLWNDKGRKSLDCVLNNSNISLTVHERNVLQFGLNKHHILPKHFEAEKIKTNLERC